MALSITCWSRVAQATQSPSNSDHENINITPTKRNSAEVSTFSIRSPSTPAGTDFHTSSESLYSESSPPEKNLSPKIVVGNITAPRRMAENNLEICAIGTHGVRISECQDSESINPSNDVLEEDEEMPSQKEISAESPNDAAFRCVKTSWNSSNPIDSQRVGSRTTSKETANEWKSAAIKLGNWNSEAEGSKVQPVAPPVHVPAYRNDQVNGHAVLQPWHLALLAQHSGNGNFFTCSDGIC